MNEYFFTFGVDHPLSGMVQVVIAPDGDCARFGMVRCYGQKWAFAYDAQDAMHEGTTVEIHGHKYTAIPRDIVVDEDNNVSVVTKE